MRHGPGVATAAAPAPLFGLVGALLAAGAGRRGLVQARQYILLKQAVVYQDDYVVLSLYQVEVEYFRLREQWLRSRSQGEDFDRGALQLRYDIWVSRVGLLNNERAVRMMVGSADYHTPLKQMQAFIARADSVLGTPAQAQLDLAALEALQGELDALGEPIHSMSLSAGHHVAEQIDVRNTRRAPAQPGGSAAHRFPVAAGAGLRPGGDAPDAAAGRTPAHAGRPERAPAGGAAPGRAGQRRQKRLPCQHEPRDPHALPWPAGHAVAAARYRAERAPGGLPAHRHRIGRPSADDPERRARHVAARIRAPVAERGAAEPARAAARGGGTDAAAGAAQVAGVAHRCRSWRARARARRPHARQADPVQPGEQRGEILRPWRGGARRAPQQQHRGRRDARIRRHRHRHRHGPGHARPAVQALFAGRRIALAAPWRHRPGPGDFAQPGAPDGWRRHGQERARRRQQFQLLHALACRVAGAAAADAARNRPEAPCPPLPRCACSWPKTTR